MSTDAVALSDPFHLYIEVNKISLKPYNKAGIFDETRALKSDYSKTISISSLKVP